MSDRYRNELAEKYARACGTAQGHLTHIKILARFPQITTLEEIVAEIEKAQAEIARHLAEEPK